MGRGVTQGDPTSPMIFNIVVDAVVRATLEVVCGPQDAWHGMELKVLECNLIFYLDERRISGREHIWVKDTVMVSVAMFRPVGLETNLDKKKVLVCTPGYIWGSGLSQRTSAGPPEGGGLSGI